MIAFAIRAFAGLSIAYLMIALAVWGLQSRFLYPAPQQPAALANGYEEITLATSDGLRLRSFLRAADEGMPTVVYFHGNGGTLGGASVSNGAIAESGLGVLLVEYRGYGGNAGDPSEQGFYRDGEAAFEWLEARGISPSDTVVIGNSIGSGVATEMALRHKPAALILVAPFTSLPEAAQETVWWLPAKRLVRDQYRNAEKVSRLNLPILIQHGDADTLIPDTHGKHLAGMASSAEYQSFKGSGHDLSFERRSQEARRDWILSRLPF